MTNASRDGRLDAVDIEIQWQRLISFLSEAALTVVKTSFSKIASEGGDFASSRNSTVVVQPSKLSHYARLHVGGDSACGRDPNVAFGTPREVGQRTSQVMDAIGLPHQIGMQRNSHDDRLSS